MGIPVPNENRNSVQFFLDDDEAAVLYDMTKVEARSAAAKSIVVKAIDAYRKSIADLCTKNSKKD